MLDNAGITNTLNSLNIVNKIKSLETALQAFIQAYGEEKAKQDNAQAELIKKQEQEEAARKKTEAVNKVKDEQAKITAALTASNIATKDLNTQAILNIQSVKYAKTNLETKKKALTNLNQKLENAKKLATAGEINTAFKSADTEINNLKTAQADFIQAYGQEKGKQDKAQLIKKQEQEEEAKNKADAIKKVGAETAKITTALDELNNATNGFKNNDILIAQSVKDAKTELETKKKALTDLYQTLEKAKNSATAAEITAAFKSADNDINNLKTAQATFIQAYNLEKNKQDKEQTEQDELKIKQEQEVKAKAEEKINQITAALAALTNATKDLNSNAVLNVNAVKTAKEKLDKHKNALTNLNEELKKAKEKKVQKNNFKKKKNNEALKKAENSENEVAELKTAQGAFIQAYNLAKQAQDELKIKQEQENKDKAEAIEKVEKEQAKITTALNKLNNATKDLNSNTVLNVNAVKTAKEKLDKHKNALTTLNQTLENAKKLVTAEKINTVFNNAENSENKINELKTAQDDFIQAYENGKIEHKKAKAEREEKQKEQQAINSAITKIQEKNFNKNTLDNAVKGISNRFVSVDKYETFFKNIKNSTGAQKNTVITKLKSFFQLGASNTFTKEQKDLAKNIVTEFKNALAIDNYGTNSLCDTLSDIEEYKILSEDDRKNLAEKINKELYENKKDFFTSAFEIVLASKIMANLFPENVKVDFYNALKTERSLTFNFKQYIQKHSSNADINGIINMLQKAKDYEGNFYYELVYNIMNHSRNFYSDYEDKDSMTQGEKITYFNRGISISMGSFFKDCFTDLENELTKASNDQDTNKIVGIKKIIELLLQHGEPSIDKLKFNNLINKDNITTLFNTLNKNIIKNYLIYNTNTDTKKDIFANVDDPKIIMTIVSALKYVGLPEKRYNEDHEIDIGLKIMTNKVYNLIKNYTNENKEDTKQALKILFKNMDDFKGGAKAEVTGHTLSNLLSNILITSTDRKELYEFLDDANDNSIKRFLYGMIYMFAERAKTDVVVLSHNDKELISYIIRNEDMQKKAQKLIKNYNKVNMDKISTFISNLKFTE